MGIQKCVKYAPLQEHNLINIFVCLISKTVFAKAIPDKMSIIVINFNMSKLACGVQLCKYEMSYFT